MVAEVTMRGLLCMQVCVPKHYSDTEALNFAEWANPCGTTGGWHVRKTGDPLLGAAPERVKCHLRPDHVHIMLDA